MSVQYAEYISHCDKIKDEWGADDIVLRFMVSSTFDGECRLILCVWLERVSWARTL
jgi:hypothetical protein